MKKNELYLVVDEQSECLAFMNEKNAALEEDVRKLKEKNEALSKLVNNAVGFYLAYVKKVIENVSKSLVKRVFEKITEKEIINDNLERYSLAFGENCILDEKEKSAKFRQIKKNSSDSKEMAGRILLGFDEGKPFKKHPAYENMIVDVGLSELEKAEYDNFGFIDFTASGYTTVKIDEESKEYSEYVDNLIPLTFAFYLLKNPNEINTFAEYFSVSDDEKIIKFA